MQLSVIVVSYNARHFLAKTLETVHHAIGHMQVEVIVVDNASPEGAPTWIHSRFPYVTLICSAHNLGFSAANNLGIAQAKGKYLLLLNPDTLVPEDTFTTLWNWAENQANLGGVGVYMIDGSGKYLPESKRGLPSPWVAFAKMTGLAKLFKSHLTFGHYHLTYLDRAKSQNIEVLSGAFLWVPKTAYVAVGGLDETYFMYGEDIDLSYQLIKAGYMNHYLPAPKIVHFKGESTQKNSFKYVKHFYNAMAIFVKRHYTGTAGKLVAMLLHMAIWVKAGLAVTNRWLLKNLAPITDALLLFGVMYGVKNYWEAQVKMHHQYPTVYLYGIVPIYIVIWLMAIYLSGGYDKPLRPWPLLRGLLVGGVAIAAFYGFLEPEWRFSRGMILAGMAASMVVLGLLRAILVWLPGGSVRSAALPLNAIIVGNPSAALAITNALAAEQGKIFVMGYVGAETTSALPHLGQLGLLQHHIAALDLQYIVFSDQDCATTTQITLMEQMAPYGIKFRWWLATDQVLLGSDKPVTTGQSYAPDYRYALNAAPQKRNKMLVNLVAASLLLPYFAVKAVFSAPYRTLLRNASMVFLGKLHAVGFSEKPEGLPPFKPGFVDLSAQFPAPVSKLQIEQYAKTYHWSADVRLLFKAIKNNQWLNF